MEYTLTFERQSYIEARGYTILMACPGSGKTTSIAFKMKSIVDELQRTTNGYGGLACLSFTSNPQPPSKCVNLSCERTSCPQFPPYATPLIIARIFSDDYWGVL